MLKDYKNKAIACLKEQLAKAKTKNRKQKLQARINAWESGELTVEKVACYSNYNS